MPKEEIEEKPETREFGEDERVETSKVDEDTDIFAEIAGTPKAAKMKAMVDKNTDDLIEEDEDSEEEDDDEDDEEDDEKEDDEKEEIKESEEEPSQKPAKKVRQKKAKKETEEIEEAEEPEEEKIEEKEIKKEKKSDEEVEETPDDEYELEDDDFESDEDENADDVDLDAKEPVELKQSVSAQKPSRDEIRKTILEKAVLAGDAGITPIGEKLEFLNDKEKKSVFIGRKANIFKKYGYEAALHIGRVREEEYNDYEVYLDSMNPHVVFVCGARGSGKCLTGDTLITLDSGEVVPIKELDNRTEKIFAINHKLKVTSADRTGFYKRTVNKILKIKMQSGKEIQLTPDHPLLTINGWKPAEEFSKGDRIATPRILPAFGNTKMKECDVKLLAYLIAEGHLDNQFVLFSNMDEKISNEFKESVLQFDPNLRVNLHSKEGCFRVAQVKKKVDLTHITRDSRTGRFTDKGYILMERSSIRKWLENIGLYGKLSAEKFIPKEIQKLEKNQLTLFLNRLFSCDGSIYRINKGKSWAVSIGFTSKKLTQQVQNLLTRYGIISTLRDKINKQHGRDIPNYEVVLYGENMIKYIQEIGFFGYKEEKAMISLEEMTSQSRNPNLDTIPIEVWDKFRVSNWKKMARELGYSPGSFHNTRNYSPSREKLAKMARIEGNSGIEMLAQSDIYWDIIKEITEINQETEVYDITVPELHNFVANDIIVHNSYVLGVIAEELADKNKNVGIIVVDPIGVFWSMRFPNKEEKEIEKLKEWGLSTSGLKNMKVFIPDGMKKEVPKSTYDAGFSILPSLLTGEDWALTFGVDRFSVSGLLLEKVLKKVEKGYKHKETAKKIPGKGKKYSLEDLINCLEYDSELNSKDKGYKPDSIRAISSRFEAAKSWGIFSEKGTPLGELSRENQMTVLDTSFLEDNVTALVIGILSRRLLSARKISTRKEAASKFKSLDMNELLEMEIPPTWLFIDEAHTLIPSGNEVTPATAGLIEYVKQGRRPGLSLVFATQQPSAINTKVLSQLDVIMSHKLIFDDDIKAVFKRTPTIMPKKYRIPNFIKTLPVGIAVTGDRSEETSRAFVMAIRPRKSQHEGRDAETSQMGETLSPERVKEMATEMLLRDVKANEIIEIQKAELAVGTLNNRYGTNIDFNSVLKSLSEKGLIVANGSIMAADYVQEKVVDEIVSDDSEKSDEENKEESKEDSEREIEEEKESEIVEQEQEPEAEATELLSLPQRISEAQARQLVEKIRKKKLFGFFGNSDRIESIQKRFFPIWKINFDVRTRKNEFIARECYINSLTGEFMHFNDGNFIESKGLAMMNGLSEEEVAVFKGLQKHEVLLEEIMARNNLDEAQARRILQKLMEKGLVSRLTEKKTQKQVYWAKQKLDLPPNERHELLGSLSRLPFVRAQALSMEREKISKEQAIDSLKKLWPSVMVKKTEVLHKPIWHVVLSEDAREKIILVDAVNGKIV